MTSDSTLIHDAELPADSTDAPDEWVELGRTAGAYGFKGWVRIAPLASGEVLEHTRNWELVDTAGVRPREGGRPSQQFPAGGRKCGVGD